MLGYFKKRLLVSSVALSLLVACSDGTNDALMKGIPMPYEQMKTVSVPNDMKAEIESGEIDIYEAYARAIKSNLPSRFDKMYQIMKQDLSKIEDYMLLPRIVALSGYNVRYSSDWNGLMVSSRLKDERGDNMAVDSTSLGAAINVLDFSIVYAAAKNSKDENEMADALRRILIKNIIEDTRVAFLKAVAGQRIKKEADKIADELTEALTYIKVVEESPEFKDKIADYRQSLLDNLSQVNLLRREVSATKIRLSGLISVDPESDFVLIVPKDIDNPYVYRNLKLNNMESFALNTRSEAKDDNDTSINPADIRAEVKKEFPMVEFGLSLDMIKSNYLLNQMWSEVGIKTGWNLLHLASAEPSIGENYNDLEKVRIMARKMAVLASVNMAYQRLEQSYQEYRISSLLDDISRNVYQKADNFGVGINRFDVIGRNIEWLFSRMKKDYAYADVKDAESSLHIALGVSATPPITMSSSVSSIARSIEERLVPTEYANKEYEEIMDISSKDAISPQPTVNYEDEIVKKKVDAWLKGEDFSKVGTEKTVEKPVEITPKKVINKTGVKVKKTVETVKNRAMTKDNSLQLGAYSREDSAIKAWETIFSKMPALSGYGYVIKNVEINGRNYSRLLIEGNKDDLVVICNQIQNTVKTCLIK